VKSLADVWNDSRVFVFKILEVREECLMTGWSLVMWKYMKNEFSSEQQFPLKFIFM
jgi:hypothetical protein